MIQYTINEESLLLTSITAVANNENSSLKALLYFDGISEAAIKGLILDNIISLTKLTVLELSDILEICKPNYYREKAVVIPGAYRFFKICFS